MAALASKAKSEAAPKKAAAALKKAAPAKKAKAVPSRKALVRNMNLRGIVFPLGAESDMRPSGGQKSHAVGE